VDQKEVHPIVTCEVPLELEYEFLVVLVICLTFISCDLELAALARLPLLADQVFNESLVSASDNLMQVEF
jgi:hypothetical protein